MISKSDLKVMRAIASNIRVGVMAQRDGRSVAGANPLSFIEANRHALEKMADRLEAEMHTKHTKEATK